jgi:membrane protein YdbS with pleckstrin-like domain
MPQRYQVFLTYGGAFVAVWYYCLIKKKDTQNISYVADIVITFAPVLFVLVVGVFLLTRLIVGVFAFRDCPYAAKEIEIQIEEAKVEMKRRKIIDR